MSNELKSSAEEMSFASCKSLPNRLKITSNTGRASRERERDELEIRCTRTHALAFRKMSNGSEQSKPVGGGGGGTRGGEWSLRDFARRRD